MINISLDFGTTNSSIAFIDNEDRLVNHSSAHDLHSYIPSIITFNGENIPEYYGLLAKRSPSNNKFSKFKLYLGREYFSEFLTKIGFNHAVTPYIASKHYINFILNDYIERTLKPKKLKLESVSVTVPEQWVYGMHHAREEIQSIFDELGFSLHSIISEPVAASAFFLYEYKKIEDTNFEGNVLICDYGGGTLDLSLVDIKSNTINILDGSGYSTSDKRPYGIGGVAYDKAVLRKLFSDEIINEKISILFEDEKLFYSEYGNLNDDLRSYIKDPKTNKELFKVHDKIVTSKVLVDAYNETINPYLIDQLIKMESFIYKHVNHDELHDLTILLVGGFSNFYLVRETIINYFSNKNIGKISKLFSHMDAVFAVSKGAALIANDRVSVNQKSPLTIGVYAYSQGKLTRYPIILKGDNLSGDIPIFRPNNPELDVPAFRVEDKNSFTSSEPYFKIYTQNSDKQSTLVDYTFKKTLDYYLPNPSIDNKWRIGFSIDQNLITTVYIEDVNFNECRKFTLGKDLIAGSVSYANEISLA